MKYAKIFVVFALAMLLVFLPVVFPVAVYAGGIGFPDITVIMPMDGDVAGTEVAGNSVALQVLFLTVLIALLPSILMVMTTFTRLIIVFSFLRSGMGTQQMPPNQVLVGLALVLTMFLMSGYISEINENAFAPFAAGQISQEEAIDRGMAPLRRFMLSQPAMGENIAFFAAIGNVQIDIHDHDTIPNSVLIPAFVLHELAAGFFIGVIIYIPFIVIDMVVASVLMAMGMMMLPPAMISLPFKIMTFLLAGGWAWIIEGLMLTFE